MSSATEASTRLQSRRWRWLNSWWMLFNLLTCGFLAAIGFAVIAGRARKRQWWLFAVGYGVATAAALVLLSLAGDSDGDGSADGAFSNTGTIIALLVWVGAIIHGLVVNREYLRIIAARSDQAWYEQPIPGAAQHPPVSHPPAPYPPVPARDAVAALGVDPQQHYAPGPAATPVTATPVTPMPATAPPSPPVPTPVAPLDVNQAAADALAALPGFDAGRAVRVVAARPVGGFRTLDEFAAAAALAPHELVRVRELVVIRHQGPPTAPAPPEPPESSGGGRGRVVDF